MMGKITIYCKNIAAAKEGHENSLKNCLVAVNVVGLL